VDPDRALRASPAYRRVELLLELDQRFEPRFLKIDAPDNGTGDVRALVRDRLVDLDRPLGVVRLGDVHPTGVAVVVA